MIKLRLKRFGKKKEASFRIVACNSTSRRDGRPLQELGFYNPRTKETRLDTEALRTRLTQGAQPTDVVRTLLEKGGLLEKIERPSIAIGKAKLEKEKAAKSKIKKEGNDSSEVESDKNEADWKFEMVELFKAGEITKARKLVCASARAEEMEEVYRWLYDNIELFGNEEQQDKAVIIIKQGLVDHTLVVDPEINLAATLIKLARL